MPYRIDVPGGNAEIEQLIDLGALDAEIVGDDAVAALMPDSVPADQVARTLGTHRVAVSSAAGRDANSVFVLSQRPIQLGRVTIVPAGTDPPSGGLALLDTSAFGTGLHPTTALCLEWLDETLALQTPETILDVGTGSGVLALAALTLGVPRAHGVDIDDGALRVAAANARLNGLASRLQLTSGGPETTAGTWPLVVANVLAAPLIEMAPTLVRRIGHRGQLVMSGIPASVEHDVRAAYSRLGLRQVRTLSRAGWIALEMRASW